jgi:hypothetical protein
MSDRVEVSAIVLMALPHPNLSLGCPPGAIIRYFVYMGFQKSCGVKIMVVIGYRR